ncbi:MAG: SMC-Scp complex subunit ScpB [Planctomycetes bacterium]|nr:SMC-Scp complex subunit ScpB [Planctomycetota bacterium]
MTSNGDDAWLSDSEPVGVHGELAASEDELEDAYRRALEALDEIELALPETVAAENIAEAAAAEDEARPAIAGRIGPVGFPAMPADGATPHEQTDGGVSVTQVIEALLFVGGEPLTAKRICGVLRGEFEPEFIDGVVDELNQRYADEERPYRVRLGEGGYRMQLEGEFEPVRNRVFGYGPREIRLSQDVLEVLSLVAYRQPLARDDVLELAGTSATAALAQLLRLELIVLERGPGGRSDVSYRTTKRFLDVFGLGGTDELPQADELSFK